MILLTGLRRVGKTTLIYQIIDELLKQNIDPYHILYFSFDEAKYQIEDIIKTYEIEILKSDIIDKQIYIFFMKFRN